MNMTFSDGSKYEDLSKVGTPFANCISFEKGPDSSSEQVIIFAVQNVVTKDACKEGYLLLKCLRGYLEVDMYFALEVHTETTIKAGRKAVIVFGELLQVKRMGYQPRTALTTFLL